MTYRHYKLFGSGSKQQLRILILPGAVGAVEICEGDIEDICLKGGKIYLVFNQVLVDAAVIDGALKQQAVQPSVPEDRLFIS